MRREQELKVFRWVVQATVLFLIVISGLGSAVILTTALDKRDTFMLVCSLFLFVVMLVFCRISDIVNESKGGK